MVFSENVQPNLPKTPMFRSKTPTLNTSKIDKGWWYRHIKKYKFGDVCIIEFYRIW